MKSDPDAGWSIKKGSTGQKEAVYGYKAHLLVDCEYELPIAANISAGNVHDAVRASNVLSEARFTTGKFHPRFFIADKGYSSKPLVKLVRRQYRARPVIDLNSGHKKLLKEFADDMRTPEWKAVYRQRTAVERVNSRLKGQRALNSVRLRGLRKVSVHCYLSLIAMQSMA